MKHHFKIIALMSISFFIAKSQPYGQLLSPHLGYKSCTGKKASINTNGFLMGAFKNNVTIGTPNFVIDKIFGGNTFKLGYMINNNVTCAASLSQNLTCMGISVLETNIPGSPAAWYVTTGTFDKGVFFALLNSDGYPTRQMYYPFPGGGGASPILKPLIIESRFSPNEYIISGTYGSQVYALRVNSGGNIIWSGFYTYGDLYANTLIECPYTGAIIIGGHVVMPIATNRASDGFVLRLNPTTGNPDNGTPNCFFTYGMPLGSCQYFNSITAAASTSGGSNGFVLGGRSDGITGIGREWFLKLDQNLSVLWSTLITPHSDAYAEPILDIVERQNTSMNYEYYGVSNSSRGSMVLKIDDMGVPFAGNNEYIYMASSSAVSSPNNISYSNSGATTGLHIYGTDNATSPSNIHFTLAYFNGTSGCNESFTSVSSYEPGPASVYNAHINKSGGFVTCTNFYLKVLPLVFTPSQICTANTIAGGSNARIISADAASAEKEISVYPNPVNDGVIHIAGSDKKQRFVLYNMLGKIVLDQIISENLVDLSSFSSGIYSYKIISEDFENCISRKLIIAR